MIKGEPVTNRKSCSLLSIKFSTKDGQIKEKLKKTSFKINQYLSESMKYVKELKMSKISVSYSPSCRQLMVDIYRPSNHFTSGNNR